MNKKSQVTIIIIIGLLVIISLGFVFYNNSRAKKQEIITDSSDVGELNTASVILDNVIDQCVKNLFILAANYIGLDADKIDRFITDQLDNCVAWEEANEYNLELDFNSHAKNLVYRE